MIISDKYKFIFIHIYKCAETSIRHALTEHSLSFRDRTSDWLYRNFGLTLPYHVLYEPHITAGELRQRIGPQKFDCYYSFAICRNPWAWQVSLFTFMRANKNHAEHEIARRFKSFDEYCRWRCDGNYQTQRDFVCSEGGDLFVDFIGKIENIDEDFKTICNRTGLPPIRLERINVSNDKPYQKFYSDFSRDLIAETFADDIRFFDYRFEA